MISGVIAGLAMLQASAPAGDIELVFWRGRDAYRLSGAAIEALVVPSLGGRIMELRLKGSENCLFAPAKPDTMGGWANHGGDNTWFAPQSLWSWPPDPWLEQKPHEVVAFDHGSITLQSPVSEAWGLQITRKITVHPNEAKVSLTTTLTNKWQRTIKVSPWQVVQVDQPERAAMELDRRTFPLSGYTLISPEPLQPGYDSVLGSWLSLKPAPKISRKVGGRGASIFAEGKWGRLTLSSEVAGTALADQGEFPDKGSWHEIYLAPKEAGYLELEALGALTPLSMGKSTSMTTYLTLEASAR